MNRLMAAARQWSAAPRPAAAENRIRAALVALPSWPEGWTLLHGFLRAKFGRQGLATAVAPAVRARISGPSDPFALRLLGILAFEAGDVRKSAILLRRSLRRHESAEVAWLFTRALLRVGDRRNAVQFAARARHHPVYRATALTTMACLAIRRGREVAGLRFLAPVRQCPANTQPRGAVAVPTVKELDASAGADRVALFRRLRLNLHVEKSPPGGTDPVLAISADARYLDRFFADYLASARTHAPGMPLHVHVIGPISPSALSHVSRHADAVTVDRSEPPKDRAYFTASRFLWLPEISALWRRPILVTDIDAEIQADPRSILSGLPGHDVACRIADHTLPWERTQVTALHLPMSEGARRFADRYSVCLATRLLHGPIPYYSDQAVLWGLTGALQATAIKPSRVVDLPFEPWFRPTHQSGIAAKTLELQGDR